MDRLTASSAKCWVVEDANRRPSVKELGLMAIDMSKHVFTSHGANERGEVGLNS